MIDIIHNKKQYLIDNFCTILNVNYVHKTRLLSMNEITITFMKYDKYFKCKLIDISSDDAIENTIKRSKEIYLISEV